MIIGGKYGHGGDVYKNKVKYDFSANINPLGTPSKVVDALKSAAEKVSAYPNPYCNTLRDKIAEKEGVDPDNILCGNGAAEVIFQMALALNPERVMIVSPTFSEYEQAFRAAGSEICYYDLKREDGFHLTEEILGCINSKTDVLVICSPNNPTGLTVKKELMRKIISRCREIGCWLLLDECFHDFTYGEGHYTMAGEITCDDPVVILRAFTKMYGMAGVRLGYCICKNSSVLEKMCSVVQPWNVSALAQAAGEAALDCEEFVEKSRAVIGQEKEYLRSSLINLGYNVLPGEANYLMFHGDEKLYDRLLKEGILIRSCSNYRGLGPGDYRIAVKSHEENSAFVSALEKLMNAKEVD